MQALANDWVEVLADENTRQVKAALSRPLNPDPTSDASPGRDQPRPQHGHDPRPYREGQRRSYRRNPPQHDDVAASGVI